VSAIDIPFNILSLHIFQLHLNLKVESEEKLSINIGQCNSISLHKILHNESLKIIIMILKKNTYYK
jgi:hypothetical protein